MGKKENLRFALDSTRSAVGRLIDDITDEESLFRGKDNLQHIRWQTGHIVYGAYLMLRTLGQAAPLPDGWYDLFHRGCTFTEDTSVYPAMAELRGKLSWYNEQITRRLETLADAELDTTLDPEPIFETSAFNTVSFLNAHAFYHAGQIAVIRRLLGRERSFG
jgi:uncharacterized damage-inducible protein DinB